MNDTTTLATELGITDANSAEFEATVRQFAGELS